MTTLTVSNMLNGAALVLSTVMLMACSDNEPDTWVSVPVFGRGGPTFATERGILPDLAARGIQPKEIICGVVRNDYIPIQIYIPPPDRVYHFLVSYEEATQLVATGKYIFRDSYDTTLPYTAIGCQYFGLFPTAS